MESDQYRLLGIGGLLNSALYLGAVFLAGLVARNHYAEYGAIASMGVAHLAYSFQLVGQNRLGIILVLISDILGAAAGIALLVV